MAGCTLCEVTLGSNIIGCIIFLQAAVQNKFGLETMASIVVVLRNGARYETKLPLDVVTEINTVVNQNQLICEALAIRHCRIQQRLDYKLRSEGKQLRFYRRRDLRYIFQFAEDILWDYWRSESKQDPDFEALLLVQEYVKASLESFVDCVLQSSDLGSQGTDSTSSYTSSTSSSSSDSIEYLKERVSVDSYDDGIELQLFVPAVTFSDTVECHFI